MFVHQSSRWWFRPPLPLTEVRWLSAAVQLATPVPLSASLSQAMNVWLLHTYWITRWPNILFLYTFTGCLPVGCSDNRFSALGSRLPTYLPVHLVVWRLVSSAGVRSDGRFCFKTNKYIQYSSVFLNLYSFQDHHFLKFFLKSNSRYNYLSKMQSKNIKVS